MRKTVIAFGSFDIIHPGHLHYLREASKYGRLVVVVARDGTIKKLKGRKSVVDENSRLRMIRAIRFVDKAMLGGIMRRRGDMYRILIKVRPDVIALGYDQRVDMPYLKGVLKENGLAPRIIRIRPFRSYKYKSSKLKELMKKY